MREKLNKKKCPPMLLCDFYKVVHNALYPDGMNKLVSYLTPRMSRVKIFDFVICFVIQAFCREYLHDYFDENFFNRNKEEVVEEYDRYLRYTIGEGCYSTERIAALHDLGYLPIEIRTIPEGTKVPIKVPMIEISNTHPDFAWVTNAIESLMSCYLWHPMISANVGYIYRQIVNRWYSMTVDDDVPRNTALGDFSMRGQESLESAITSSAGFALSFLNTATVPCATFLENNYYCNVEKEPVIKGAASTEHSVMCSNYAVDGDEITMVKRLLKDIYYDTSFSMVSDSYDYWNMVENIIPSCREDIENHNGVFLVRPDSGDPANIVCGTCRFFGEGNTPEEKGTVEVLWEKFGGTVNSKGYKVLNKKIKVIYGDSITISRAEDIYSRLQVKGFAANNVTFGVGSFSQQCIELPNGELQPFTRDTLSIAVKATYCEVNGKPIHIFKNPKTDSGHFKKSQKGCCIVYIDADGEIDYEDGHNWEDSRCGIMKTIFKDSQMMNESSLAEIRNRLHGGKF